MARKLGVLIALLVILGVWLFVEPVPAKLANDLELRDLDLGNIHQTDLHEAKVRLRNVSTEELNIINIDAGCTCLVVNHKPQPLSPHSFIDVPIKIKTAGASTYTTGKYTHFKIMLYVNYQNSNNANRIANAYVTGHYETIVQCASHLVVTNHNMDDSGNLSSINELQVFHTPDTELSTNISGNGINISETIKTQFGSRILIATSPQYHGKINSRLLINATRNGMQMASKEVVITGYSELFRITPSLLTVHFRPEMLLLVIDISKQANVRIASINIGDCLWGTQNLLRYCSQFQRGNQIEVRIPTYFVLYNLTQFTKIRMRLHDGIGDVGTVETVCFSDLGRGQ